MREFSLLCRKWNRKCRTDDMRRRALWALLAAVAAWSAALWLVGAGVVPLPWEL